MQLMKYNAVICNTMKYNTIEYSAVICNTAKCNIVKCNAVKCDAVRCSAMKCNAPKLNETHSIALHYMWPQCSGKIPQGGCHVLSIAGTRDKTHRTGKRVKGWRDDVLYFIFGMRSKPKFMGLVVNGVLG